MNNIQRDSLWWSSLDWTVLFHRDVKSGEFHKTGIESVGAEEWYQVWAIGGITIML